VSGALKVGLDLVFLGPRAGGIGRYARELLGALAADRRGVEVHAFTSRDEPAGLREEPWAPAVRWTQLPVRLDGPPLHLAATFAAIPALAVARGLHVLHGPANSVAVHVPRLPSVVTMHDVIWRRAGEDWGPPEAIRAMERVTVRSVRRADRVLADSGAAAGELERELGLDPSRIDVVPLGVRVDPDAPATPEPVVRKRLALGDGPVVLCVAQKRRYKNQAALVRAAAALGDDAVRLVLPGAPTPYEHELRALADHLGCADRVRFPAWVAEEDLEGLYRLSACVVLPSLVEGFGLPLLEAMARGVPVACSNRSALPEVAGEAAVLFDPADQAAVTGAIARLLHDRALAATLARRGRERAAAFSWRRTAELTIAAYRRAVAQRRR
jgi:glycosyltransferase involved in cell wall biosynthesis